MTHRYNKERWRAHGELIESFLDCSWYSSAGSWLRVGWELAGSLLTPSRIPAELNHEQSKKLSMSFPKALHLFLLYLQCELSMISWVDPHCFMIESIHTIRLEWINSNVRVWINSVIKRCGSTQDIIDGSHCMCHFSTSFEIENVIIWEDRGVRKKSYELSTNLQMDPSEPPYVRKN